MLMHFHTLMKFKQHIIFHLLCEWILFGECCNLPSLLRIITTSQSQTKSNQIFLSLSFRGSNFQSYRFSNTRVLWICDTHRVLRTFLFNIFFIYIIFVCRRQSIHIRTSPQQNKLNEYYIHRACPERQAKGNMITMLNKYNNKKNRRRKNNHKIL